MGAMGCSNGTATHGSTTLAVTKNHEDVHVLDKGASRCACSLVDTVRPIRLRSENFIHDRFGLKRACANLFRKEIHIHLYDMYV